MKAYTVAEIKRQFSRVLADVEKGERVKILYGRAKRPVAMLVPPEKETGPRSIGPLEGRASFRQRGYGKISPEEFLGR